MVKTTFTKSLKSAFYCFCLFVCLLGQHLVKFTFFAVKIRNFASSKGLDREFRGFSLTLFSDKAFFPLVSQLFNVLNNATVKEPTHCL